MADKETVAPFNRTPFTKGVQRGYNWNGVYRYVFRNNSTWWAFIIVGAAFGDLIVDKVTNGIWSSFNPGVGALVQFIFAEII